MKILRELAPKLVMMSMGCRESENMMSVAARAMMNTSVGPSVLLRNTSTRITNRLRLQLTRTERISCGIKTESLGFTNEKKVDSSGIILPWVLIRRVGVGQSFKGHHLRFKEMILQYPIKVLLD